MLITVWTTSEYAAAAGVSPRVVRRAAGAGRVPAHRAGHGWVFEETAWNRRPASSRRMGQAMRELIVLTLNSGRLPTGVGPLRSRVAGHVRALRTAQIPAVLLQSWWYGAPEPTGWSLGALLVRAGLAGRDQQVRDLLARSRRRFVVDASQLAVLVRDERAIAGWTRDELAAAAGVSGGFVTDVEAGQPGQRIAAVMAVLRALGVPVAGVGLRATS
ncbi:MAG: helix-turn-helix domain-containing protein [Micrococcales bacterium]|nr:helix-turn-helix domain-containing protein [Micrococcales bacterium]